MWGKGCEKLFIHFSKQLRKQWPKLCGPLKCKVCLPYSIMYCYFRRREVLFWCRYTVTSTIKQSKSTNRTARKESDLSGYMPQEFCVFWKCKQKVPMHFNRKLGWNSSIYLTVFSPVVQTWPEFQLWCELQTVTDLSSEMNCCFSRTPCRSSTLIPSVWHMTRLYYTISLVSSPCASKKGSVHRPKSYNWWCKHRPSDGKTHYSQKTFNHSLRLKNCETLKAET